MQWFPLLSHLCRRLWPVWFHRTGRPHSLRHPGHPWLCSIPQTARRWRLNFSPEFDKIQIRAQDKSTVLVFCVPHSRRMDPHLLQRQALCLLLQLRKTFRIPCPQILLC